MLEWTENQLRDVSANITTGEIIQQPVLWAETVDIYNKNREEINRFLSNIREGISGKTRIIFTGAGSSAYVGDVITPHLTRFGDTDNYLFGAVPTTDIVSTPYAYLKEDEPTLLVSFARSGNSPESIAAVNIANKVVKHIHHLIITCDEQGELARENKLSSNALSLIMPKLSNDKGFAMTGSFSCMTLMGLLVFDTANIKKEEIVASIISMGRQAIQYEKTISYFLKNDFSRIIYLGSGSLSGLTREAQLKVLELTAGKVATVFDSSMGVRHGPKSFIDEKTMVLMFVSNDPYTQKYDIDILEEISSDNIASVVLAISQNDIAYTGNTISLGDKTTVSDGYLSLPFILIAQIVALLSSIKVKNKPDTPSATGTVNRVVKGVTIHSITDRT